MNKLNPDQSYATMREAYKYLFIEKNKIVNLQAQNIPKFNARMIMREYKNDKNILKMRNLICWESFSFLYYYYQKISKASLKNRMKITL